MNRLLSLQATFQKIPFGQALFSYVIARNTPYFLTINPHILALKPHFCQIRMRKRRRIENHIRTVHAIAMCNLCELAAGLCIEASLPKKYRWIPAGMQVSYLKKATTDLIATCELDDLDWENQDKVACFVLVRDKSDVEVMNATIQMYISLKK